MEPATAGIVMPDVSVATLFEGDFFGEMTLLIGERRSASVIALEDVECIKIRCADSAPNCPAVVGMFAARSRIGTRKPGTFADPACARCAASMRCCPS